MSDDAQHIDPELLDDIDPPAPAKRTLLEWTFVHSRAIILGTGAVLVAGLAYAISTTPKPQPQPVQIIDTSEHRVPQGVARPVGTSTPPGEPLGNVTVRGEALLDATVVTSNPAEAVRQMANTFKTIDGKQYRVSVMVWQEK